MESFIFAGQASNFQVFLTYKIWFDTITCKVVGNSSVT